MLVLSRKVGQSVIIGNDIVVRLLEIRGQQVRLGIDAPAEVSVVREELHRSVADANREAADTDQSAELPPPAKVRRRPGPPEGGNA